MLETNVEDLFSHGLVNQDGQLLSSPHSTPVSCQLPIYRRAGRDTAKRNLHEGASGRTVYQVDISSNHYSTRHGGMLVMLKYGLASSYDATKSCCQSYFKAKNVSVFLQPKGLNHRIFLLGRGNSCYQVLWFAYPSRVVSPSRWIIV